MPAVGRKGDNCTGHGCWPSRPAVSGSPNVTINNIPALRVDDAYAAHTCPAIPETHDGNQAQGSSSVTVNAKALSRVGDNVSCGGALAEGSPNVTSGD